MTGEMDPSAIHACKEIKQKCPNVSGGTLRTMLSFASGGSKAIAAAGHRSLLTTPSTPYTTPTETVRWFHTHPVVAGSANALVAAGRPGAHTHQPVVGRPRRAHLQEQL
ncbi:hypothetical protein DHEL01_v208090 [Diaporthe helianthi]|uniref:Uncharacterized protein n=1 Tax=Diaporthe helianthi TaxID=158607 RepID=A0A2P5HTD6_DIAHE|nr:hypothetical protein DHEL01_v208090 [Diaporthe helianthi]